MTPTPEQLAAVARFAAANGRNWKQKLNDAWFNGTDANEPDGCYLRQVRNQFGPRWLRTFRLETQATEPPRDITRETAYGRTSPLSFTIRCF